MSTTLHMEFTPILLMREPIPTAEGRPENAFRASRAFLTVLEAEGIEPAFSVNMEVYSVKGKLGVRAPISLRLTGADAVQLGLHLISLGKECLLNERE